MPKAESFILSTDFATLKNDAAASTSVTAPGSATVVGGSYVEYHSDLNIGVVGSLTRIQVSSSKNSNSIQVTRFVAGSRTGVVLGSPAAYGIYAFVYRLDSDTLRCQVYIPNPYADSLTTEAGDETFTFYVNTFLPPYA